MRGTESVAAYNTWNSPWMTLPSLSRIRTVRPSIAFTLVRAVSGAPPPLAVDSVPSMAAVLAVAVAVDRILYSRPSSQLHYCAAAKCLTEGERQV
jgi:hypothetical protein